MLFIMKRDINQKLVKWKRSSRRKPLVLRGARQVGKTYALKALAGAEYESLAYINFESSPLAKSFFQVELDPQRIIKNLEIFLNQTISPLSTLIVFDEIQECPEALNSLKYFNEQANQYHIATAGSLLGVKLAHTKGFPVGKVNFLDLYPLSFFEFLEALGKVKLRHYLNELADFKPLPEALHNELIDCLKLFMFVGGMPEAVSTYNETADFISIREIHNEILLAYTQDFIKHAGAATDVMKITAVWDSIPSQLAKENKKFIFSIIRKSARGREYEAAIQWLVDAGMIYKAYEVSVPRVPLSGYRDQQAFKVFLLDVGLLGAMSQLPPDIIIHGDKFFTEFKGAFTENYVAQELASQHNKELYYWSSDGKAEVDFLTVYNQKIYPLEVKSGNAIKSKSLQVYGARYKSILARASLHNLSRQGNLFKYPLYLVGRFPNLQIDCNQI